MKQNIKIPVEVFTRTVGYYAPVKNTNPGKKEEISERKYINMNNLKSIMVNKDEI